MQVNRVNSSPSFGLLLSPVYLEKAPTVLPAIVEKATIPKSVPAKYFFMPANFFKSKPIKPFHTKEAIIEDMKIRVVKKSIPERKMVNTPKECRNTGRVNIDKRIDY